MYISLGVVVLIIVLVLIFRKLVDKDALFSGTHEPLRLWFEVMRFITVPKLVEDGASDRGGRSIPSVFGVHSFC